MYGLESEKKLDTTIKIMPLQEIPVWSMVQTSSDNIEDKFNESIEQRAKREEWALVFKLSLEDSKN